MQGRIKTVVIVDDIAIVRKNLRAILTQMGFQVIAEAKDGFEAIQAYDEHRPDLVTMDLVMPKMNGVDATQRIMSRYPEAKIIVLSAMFQENLVSEAIVAGAKDYLMKPFQSSEVQKVLGNVLGISIHDENQNPSGGVA